ncbi:hypothetical protein [Lentilactobacillus buchneri]|nr:hypothetical protein [Lentilactobacillus buchneri]MCC6102189.1 hypothetical protein [Lactobacillus sp.]WCJ52518.1 hypothetical protein OKF32_04155 [Lentilactobacillus sp. Egmn17]AEB74267.1 hypothetical protein Lbuc_2022 [Lentilactobacillus buchneri NRRL B-30929]MDS1014674.1 hypothetical protein [Lentilactobacillus buchneri]QUX06369.1 hypothetical protein KE627_04275 [Lentilactobacillus buchneri]
MVNNIWLRWFFVLLYLVMGILLYLGMNMVVMYLMVIGMFLEALCSLIGYYHSK